jgi:hypothetical protein
LSPEEGCVFGCVNPILFMTSTSPCFDTSMCPIYVPQCANFGSGWVPSRVEAFALVAS